MEDVLNINVEYLPNKALQAGRSVLAGINCELNGEDHLTIKGR